MDVKALQARLRTFAAERDWPPFHSPKNLAMALMVEAAELLELFQWLTTAQSHTLTKDPHDKERVGDEMADVLLYLLQLADHTGVDLAEAAERKMRKNAIKHPAKHAELMVSAPTPAPAPVVVNAVNPTQEHTSPKVHLLIDWENVQPRGEQLKELAPRGTDVWLFHSPQQRIDQAWHADYGSRVTAVPIARPGKNALDFHLSYYMGYISARQPDATFIVIANDKGYDPMLEHARNLGFLATRREFRKPVAALPVQTEKIVDKILQDMAAAQASPAPKKANRQPALVQAAVVQPQRPAGVVAQGLPLQGKVKTTALLKPSVQASNALAPADQVPDKATRQDIQALVQFLKQMKPSYRPARREVLLALIKAQLGEPSAYSPRVADALAQLRAQQCLTLKGDGVIYLPLPGVVQAAPKVAPAKKEAAKKHPVRAVEASPSKLIRQKQTQQAVQFLKQMAAGERPVRRNALLALLAAQWGVASVRSPAVVHAMAHLLAQGWVAVQGESVLYPRWTPPTKPVVPKTTAKKKGVGELAAAAKALKKPLTPAQMGSKVLASLAKMPGNLPARQPALLALIRAQIGALPGDDAVAHQVLSLLQAQGAVAMDGTTLTYPLLVTKTQASVA